MWRPDFIYFARVQFYPAEHGFFLVFCCDSTLKLSSVLLMASIISEEMDSKSSDAWDRCRHFFGRDWRTTSANSCRIVVVLAKRLIFSFNYKKRAADCASEFGLLSSKLKFFF